MKKEFEINTEIYSEDIIKQAISDFEDVSVIIFENNKIKLEGDSEIEIDEIFNELMNYVI
jgi:hypothetical protein